jgi:hypothetical protein
MSYWCNSFKRLFQLLISYSFTSRWTKWVWRIGGIRLPGESRNTLTVGCPILTLSTTNPIWTDLGSDPGLSSKELEISFQSHSMDISCSELMKLLVTQGNYISGCHNWPWPITVNHNYLAPLEHNCVFSNPLKSVTNFGWLFWGFATERSPRRRISESKMSNNCIF